MKRNLGFTDQYGEPDLVYAVSPAGHRQAYLDLFASFWPSPAAWTKIAFGLRHSKERWTELT
ncbi:MAG: hypothetical protein E5V22_01225 [Mesorhizobium sp.]|nr:MAG: hypothetical protein E5V22_01225 [Mesorhizobium sp.]